MVDRSIFYYASSPRILKTSFKISLLVGTIIALINHHDSIIAWSFTTKVKIEIIVTYFIPFCVATYSAANHVRRIHRIRLMRMEKKKTVLNENG